MTTPPLDALTLIARLKLQPLPAEGGFFVETYRSPLRVQGQGQTQPRSASTAIFYLLTDHSCSRLHRLASDEMWHCYLGDPVEQIQLGPSGQGQVITLGHDLMAGHVCQSLVPRGVWQGARLRPGGRWALLGCTVAPGFEFADFELANQQHLLDAYPEFQTWIEALS